MMTSEQTERLITVLERLVQAQEVQNQRLLSIDNKLGYNIPSALAALSVYVQNAHG